jgi:hypothetical protein
VFDLVVREAGRVGILEIESEFAGRGMLLYHLAGFFPNIKSWEP